MRVQITPTSPTGCSSSQLPYAQQPRDIDRDEIVIAHIVLNLDTGEGAFVAGRALGAVEAMACDARN